MTSMKAKEIIPSWAIEKATLVPDAITPVAAADPAPTNTRNAVPSASARSFCVVVGGAAMRSPSASGRGVSPPPARWGLPESCSTLSNDVSRNINLAVAAGQEGNSGFCREQIPGAVLCGRAPRRVTTGAGPRVPPVPRSEVTTPGSGLGNTSVPRPGRPFRPVGVGVFGWAEVGKLADGKRGQILFQLRAGDSAGQYDRCPRLGQRGGQRNRVFGDAARRGHRGQRRRRPARRRQPPVGDRLLDQDRPPGRGGFGRGRAD